MPGPDDLDGCALGFDDAATNTGDADIDALVMFADCWDDPAAVERRRVDLIDWSNATGSGTDA